MIYSGMSEVSITSFFSGVLIAPNAKLNLSANPNYVGWYYGKDVEVQPDTVLRVRPGLHVCLPSLGCEEIVEPPPPYVPVELPAPISNAYPPGGGAVEWTFDVDGAGQAVYTIAIEVPPGPGGIEPRLSLVYRSGRGNGSRWARVGRGRAFADPCLSAKRRHRRIARAGSRRAR